MLEELELPGESLPIPGEKGLVLLAARLGADATDEALLLESSLLVIWIRFHVGSK
jgi:hypothetical protein